MKIRILLPWLHHRASKRDMKFDTIVLHATETASLEEALEILRDRKLSYHYIINKKVEISSTTPLSLVNQIAATKQVAVIDEDELKKIMKAKEAGLIDSIPENIFY